MELKEIEKLIEYMIDECDDLMSRADHRKKIASFDYHTAETNHQEGRWHCANDMKEFCETKLKEKLQKTIDNPAQPVVK